MDLAVLHHIPLLISSVPFLTLLLCSYFFLFVFLISTRKREGRDKGERIDKFHLLCALFCLSFSFINLSSILVFALPVKNQSCLFILLLLPSPFSSPTKNTRKDKNTGKWRPFSFLMLFQWLGKVTWPLSMLQRIPPLALSPRFFPLFPNGKESEFLSFSLFFLWFFISKANEQERRKTRKRGKTKTSTIFSLPRAKPEP